MAELAGKTITPHVSSGFCFVYVLHLASFTPNLGSYQEHKRGIPESNELLGGILTLKDGAINIPDTPGLGIDHTLPVFKHAIRIK
jgi:L-alanine-DL-glutamate epimerase-like enolase superfamily enzyme